MSGVKRLGPTQTFHPPKFYSGLNVKLGLSFRSHLPLSRPHFKEDGTTYLNCIWVNWWSFYVLRQFGVFWSGTSLWTTRAFTRR